MDLAEHLQDKGKLGLAEIAAVVVPVAAAVHAAHEAGVIHRDLKPSNILLARRSGGGVSPIILDFGISKITSDVESDLTASAVLLGTVHYMSPEQTRGGRQASAASDQYALGVLLYECATGAKPFVGSTPYAVMHAIVSARVGPPSAIDAELPVEFDKVVMRAMQRDPQRRFESVRALGAALLPWASDATRTHLAAELGVDASSRPHRASRARSWRSVLAAVAALSVVVAVGARFLLGSEEHAAAAGPTSSDPPPAVAASLPSLPPVSSPPEVEPAAIPESSAAPAPSPSLSVSRPATRGAASGRVPSAPPSGTPSALPPERGTNGALIVE
jgi:serine/threonine-protein kinase